MATVKFLNNILSKDIKIFSVDKGATIGSIIRKNADENVYRDILVECYDLETGKTFYAPIEDNENTINAIVQVNGEDKGLNYKVKENDIVEIIITPANGGGNSGFSWLGAFSGFIEGLLTGLYLSGGQWWGALVGGLVGFFAGGLIGGMVADQKNKVDNNGKSKSGMDSERLADVRGASNQPLLDQPYPVVLGKHLVTPFIIGSPYNDISGAHGEQNYINVLYVIGYGPLRLTDFRLGEQMLAHNQSWSGNPSLKNIWNGTLWRTDENAGSGADTGEITNVWKNNDITLEILQQSPGRPVDYGAVYPYAKIQKDIKANVLFIADGSMEEIDKGKNISYKGLGLQNGLRNNPIYFSEQYPASLKVELDFQQGLYKSRSETSNNQSDVHYYQIPMYVAIQWRVFSEDNDKADGGNAGTGSLPTFNYNTQSYNLIDGKAKRYWNSFDSINKVNLNWDDTNVNPWVGVSYTLITNTSTDRPVTTLSIQKIWSNGINGEFKVIIEYKTRKRIFGNEEKTRYLEYTLPANTEILDIGEYVSDASESYAIQKFVGLTIKPLTSGFKAAHAETTRSGFFGFLTGDVGAPIDAQNFTWQAAFRDKEAHTGQTYNASGINTGWVGSKVFNIETLGGTDNNKDGINEFRCITEVDLLAWAETNLRAAGDSDETFANKVKSYFFDSTNTTKSVEVRVVRISPCYLDETVSTEEHSAFKFNDLFVWSTLSSTMLDGDELLKNNRIVKKRPLSEEDMRKLCVVALKAKTDNVDQLSNTIRKFTCIAESFNPYFDTKQRKWFPENVTKSKKYVKLVNGKWEQITESEYYIERQSGDPERQKKTKCVSAGNNYLDQIINNAIDIYYHYDEDGRIFIPDLSVDNTMKFCDNNVASVFLYAGIGPHLGNDALGYSQSNFADNTIGDFNMDSLSTWYKWAEDRTDGSTYTYDGYHYNHNGEEVPHRAGELVHVYFTANAYIYNLEMLETILANIAIAGQAVYTRDSKNRLRIVVDKTERYPVALFNQKNILKSSHTISFAELPSGIQINFPDENDGYNQNQIYRMVDGESDKEPLGAIEPYSFKFVTNNNQIWFLGGYVLANRILNKEVVSITMGAEGSSIALGDIILYSDDTMLIGTDHGGRITQLIEDDNYIYGFIINDVYHLKGDANFGVVVMQPTKYKEYRVITLAVAALGTTKTVNGTTYTATKGKTNTVLLRTNISKSQYDPNGNDFYVYKPEAGNVVSFGTIGSITSTYRVVKIKPEENQKYTFTLLKYTDKLYTAGKALPSFQNNMTIPSRSMENHFALSNNVTTKQLVDSIAESANQAKGMIDSTLGKTPSVPTNLVMTVDQSGLHFSCTVETNGINNVDYISYEITKQSTATVTINGTYSESYTFNHDAAVDGYPEQEDLSQWKIRAKAVSMYTDGEGNKIESAFSDYVFISSASLSAYGTWQPAVTSFVTKKATEGGIVLEWNKAAGLGSRNLYGSVVYDVTIKYNDTQRIILRTTGFSTVYNFDRSVDGYPEKPGTPNMRQGTLTLDNYTVQIRATNTVSGKYADGSALGINYMEYKTWIPPTITVAKELMDRTVILSALYDNNNFYGNQKLLVKIKRHGNEDPVSSESIHPTFNELFGIKEDDYFYIPEFDKSVRTSSTQDNEPNYKADYPEVTSVPQSPSEGDIIFYKGETSASFTEGKYYEYDGTEWNELNGAFEYIGYKITHTLPLIGQTYRIYKEGNESVFNGAVEVTTVPQTPALGDKILYLGVTDTLTNGKYYIYTGSNWNELVYFSKDIADYSVVPSEPVEGQIIHYTGSDSGIFTEGFYYICEGETVTPESGDNPNEKGWYILDSGHFELTTDTSVVSGTTYYTVWKQCWSKAFMVPTTYVYSIQMTNESGNLSNLLDDIEVTAQPTNISDIVHSHEHYKDLYVEKLSAINANLGMISQGGMGEFKDWKNFWALSDLSAEDSGVAGGVKKGSFRVGGDDQFLEVMPDPDHEGQYLITLQAGNITLTSGSDASFKQGTYIYDKVDPRKRLALTSTGMLAQQDVSETEGVEDWVNMAEVRTDELGNMIITNSDNAPVVGVQANGTIYHFDDTSHPFYEEVGEGVTPSNPEGLSGDGAITQIDDDAIIKGISSSKCYAGTVQKVIGGGNVNYTGTMVFFSKSNMVKPNDEQMIRITGAVDDTNAKEYNDLMSQTKDSGTVGSYLGLTATQISNRIFTED